MLRSIFYSLIVVLITFTTAFAQLNNNPDRIETDKGELVIHPILHGTAIFEWNGNTVYMDPW